MAGPCQDEQLGTGFEKAFLTVGPQSNFLPYPRTTLLVDASFLGQCGICRDSQLLLRSACDEYDDQTVAIMPCGHIAGYMCLKDWFKNKRTCPFCRLPLEYEFCKHPSKLIRPLTKETIHSIADPVPVGGKIRDQCVDCSLTTDRVATQALLDGLAEMLRMYRARYQTKKDEQERLILKRRISAVRTQIDTTMKQLITPSDMARSGW